MPCAKARRFAARCWPRSAAMSSMGISSTATRRCKVRTGERPLLANGRLIVIDGGMSEAYQPVTGIAGYTLIANSHELLLAVHEAFTSADEMIRAGQRCHAAHRADRDVSSRGC